MSRYNFILKIIKQNSIKNFSKVNLVDCASGKSKPNVKLLNSQGFKEIRRYDIDPDFNLPVEYGNICKCPCESDFAHIFICSETLEHLKPDDTMLAVQEIKRITKINGLVIITVPNNEVHSMQDPLHLQFLSKDKIIEFFSDDELVYYGDYYAGKKAQKRLQGNSVLVFKMR